MADILTMANKLKAGEILELKTPFVPAPIIDILREKECRTFSIQKENVVVNYFEKM